jgi:2-polyprenyl-6-methoxyphenol hydroxylase-like FAD-dependent oxidoreductase
MIPGIWERVQQGHREDRIYGTADLPNFFRKPYGPGWALVGDAGYHKDPITGYGITDAFRDVELLADAVDAGLSGRETLETALAGYQQRRDEIALPLYELMTQMATLQPPPPELLPVFAALSGNQEQVNRYFGVLDGTVPVAEFLSPENIGAIMAAAGQPAAV